MTSGSNHPGSLTGLRPTYRVVEGLRMPCGFPPEGLHSALSYKPRANDIIVSTYPKCGTTWTQNIIYMLFNNGQPVAPDDSIRELFPHLEEKGREFIEQLPEPRLIKTHLPLPMAPFNSDAKFVYVVRNPFDCAVSFFHHTRGFTKHYDFSNGTFADYFESFIEGAVDFGDYFDHLMSWYAVTGQDNVYFVTYEALKRDLDREIVRLGRFLGGVAEQVANDPQRRAQVVAASSFDHMARDQLRWASKRPEGQTDFVRKGIVGDWKNHFSTDQLRRLLEKSEAVTRGTDILDQWSDIYAEIRAACSA